MADNTDPVGRVADLLCVTPLRLDEAVPALPQVEGLYAWWAPPRVLPTFGGLINPVTSSHRLLYIGIALRLRAGPRPDTQ